MSVAALTADEELDATGLLCPLPVLKARKRLKSLNIGAVLRVTADDPASVIDFPHFCAEQGHELIRQADVADVGHVFWIRKA
ncbi:MAG: sulfurtransferase TusA family protein [Pikeienuella sp.]